MSMPYQKLRLQLYCIGTISFCYFHGKVYEHPGGTSVGHAFLMWCYVLRKECEGRCYDSMDFSQVCEQLMDKKEVVNNDRNIDGFFYAR